MNRGEQFRGSIVVNNGKIVEILREDELPRLPCDRIIEATGLYLMPINCQNEQRRAYAIMYNTQYNTIADKKAYKMPKVYEYTP